MTGRKLLPAVSLLLLALAPAGAVSADVKAQSSARYLRHNDPSHDKTRLLCDALNDPDNAVMFPGNKADFLR